MKYHIVIITIILVSVAEMKPVQKYHTIASHIPIYKLN